jgi:hypothetical protein
MREETIMLLSVILNQYYFQLTNIYYKPYKGIAMRSSIPSTAAAEMLRKCDTETLD